MEKRSKPSKDFTRQIQSIGDHRQRKQFHRVLVCGLILAFVSLSCAIGVLDQNDPLFNAPNGILWTPTPSLVFPTDKPKPDLTSDPSTGEILNNSTEVPTPETVPVDTAPLLYYTQAGDTLPVVAIRFGVKMDDITPSTGSLPKTGLLTPNTLLIIPHMLVNTTSPAKIIPDSELVYSPSALDFDVAAYVNKAGGFLSKYQEWLGSTQWTSGADVVSRVAIENSINP